MTLDPNPIYRMISRRMTMTVTIFPLEHPNADVFQEVEVPARQVMPVSGRPTKGRYRELCRTSRTFASSGNVDLDSSP